MKKYSFFILSILVKKKSFYLCFLLLGITFFGIFYPNIINLNNDLKQALFPISTFTKWFPFVFSTIFVSLVIIRLFKTGETDGTELLISAKPIKRWNIVISKFFILIFMIILFQLFLFPIYFAIVQLDKYASTNDKLYFAFSMVVGGIIVSLIMSFLIVIISSFIGKVGTIIFGTILSAATPILSFTIVPISNALSSDNQENNFVKQNPVFFLNSTEKTNSIYDPKKQNEDTSKPIFMFSDQSRKQIIDNKNSWYKHAKYFDLWYQLGRFYSLIKDSPSSKQHSISYNLSSASYEEIKRKEFLSLIAKAKNASIKTFYNQYHYYIGLFSKQALDFERNILSFDKEEYKKLTKTNGSLLTWLNNLEDKINQRFAASRPLNKIIWEQKDTSKIYGILLEELNKTTLIKKNKIDSKYKNYIRILIWRMIVDYQANNLLKDPNNSVEVQKFNSLFERGEVFNFWRFLFPWNNSSSKYLEISSGNYQESNSNSFSYENFKKYHFSVFNYKEKKYLETMPIIVFWSFASVIFIISAIVIYLKRDFK